MANWQDDFELASNYTDDSLAAQAKGTAEDAVTAAAEAAETAKTAQAAAGEAKTTAEIAHETATAADDKAATAKQTAEDATSAATVASTTAAAADKKAEQAVGTASAAQTTAEAADTKAAAADTKAAAADTKATQAATDAAAAKTTANGAASTASTAKTTAEGAVEAATAAKTTAESAASTASTAKTTADAAKTTAETAKATADTANTTATAADTKADEAKVIAEAAIQSVDVEYALGGSATAAPTSGWSTTAPAWVSGKYMWQRTKTITSSGSTYSNPTCISGAKGDPGSAGKGIKSTAVTYQASMSGTIAPTGTWTTSVPSVATNQFLWTRAITTYTDNTTTTAYSIGKMGADGTDGSDGADGAPGAAGRGVKSTAVTYQASTSGTNAPTGTWSTSVPSVSASQYLWTRTVTTYTDSTTSTAYSVGMMGAQGVSCSKIVEQYYLSTSSSSQVGGSWSTTCPTWVNGKYIWTRSQVTWSNSTITYTTPVLANALNSANSTAASANATATAAATTADTAKNTAETAQATAEATANYFMADSSGAYIASVEGNHDAGKNLKLSTDGVAIRDGVGEVATFGASEIKLGQDSAIIDMAGGLLVVGAKNVNGSHWGEIGCSDSLQMMVPYGRAVHLGMRASDGTSESDVGIGLTGDGVAAVSGTKFIVNGYDYSPKIYSWSFGELGLRATVSGGWCQLFMNGIASWGPYGLWTDFTTNEAKAWLKTNAPKGTSKAFGVGFMPASGIFLFFQLGGNYELWNQNTDIPYRAEVQLAITYPIF